MANHWDGENWIKNMRMSNNAFNFLCNTLRPHVSEEDTRFRKCNWVRQINSVLNSTHSL